MYVFLTPKSADCSHCSVRLDRNDRRPDCSHCSVHLDEATGDLIIVIVVFDLIVTGDLIVVVDCNEQ